MTDNEFDNAVKALAKQKGITRASAAQLVRDHLTSLVTPPPAAEVPADPQPEPRKLSKYQAELARRRQKIADRQAAEAPTDPRPPVAEAVTDLVHLRDLQAP